MKFNRGLFLGMAAALSASVSYAGDCGCAGASAAPAQQVASGCGGCGGSGAVSGGVVSGGVIGAAGAVAGGAGCGAQISYVERTVMVPTQVTEKRTVSKTVYNT
ncbi:MAG: hypothetical protein ACKOAH_31160, partial [Pirellula sp.]